MPIMGMIWNRGGIRSNDVGLFYMPNAFRINKH